MVGDEQKHIVPDAGVLDLDFEFIICNRCSFFHICVVVGDLVDNLSGLCGGILRLFTPPTQISYGAARALELLDVQELCSKGFGASRIVQQGFLQRGLGRVGSPGRGRGVLPK